jgi:hypothetical protein
MLDRLLSCMGYRLETVRRPVRQGLDRSVKRSWELHRRLSTHLTRETPNEWRPIMLRNLQRLREGTRGQPICEVWTDGNARHGAVAQDQRSKGSSIRSPRRNPGSSVGSRPG